MTDKLFLINENQAAAFLGCAVSTLLNFDRYRYHCPHIKEGGTAFFNEDDLIKFKEKRDAANVAAIPKEPIPNKQKINPDLQFKWDVFLLTRFFTSPESRIYDMLHTFAEKHSLKLDFNDCPFYAHLLQARALFAAMLMFMSSWLRD